MAEPNKNTPPQREVKNDIEFIPVPEPRLHVYSADGAEVKSSWEAPKGETKAHYSRMLDDSIADNFQGNDFKTIREVLGDNDTLVVLIDPEGATMGLHGDLRWQETREDGGIHVPSGGDSEKVDLPRVYVYATDEGRDDIQISWEKPSPDVKTTALYSRGLDDSVADDYRGSEFRTVREVLADGDQLVVIKGGGMLHADLRWSEKQKVEK